MISVERANALEQVKKLEQAAEECITAKAEINKAWNQSAECWKGNAADAMREQYEKTMKELDRTHDKLINVANIIKQVVDELLDKDAELANVTVATLGEVGSALKNALGRFL